MPEEKGLTFQDYLYVLFTRRWVIIIVFFVTFGASLFYTLITPKTYKATATLMVQAENIPGALGFGSSPLYYPYIVNIQKYCEILKSEAIASRAIDKLKLDNPRIDFPILKHKNPALVLKRRIFIKSLEEANIIKVSITSTTSKEAMATTNAVIEAFVEQQLLSIRGEYAEQRRFLEEQIPIVGANLREAEKRLKTFKERNKFVSLLEETRQLIEKLANFDELHGETEATRKSLQSRMEFLKNQLAEQKESLAEDITQVSSPYILDIRKELIAQEIDYSLYMVQGLRKTDPKMISLKKSIEDTKSKLTEETRKIANQELPSLDPLSFSQQLVDKILALQVEIATQEARGAALSKIKKNYERELGFLPKKELELIQLEREREISNNIYQMLSQKHEEIKIVEAGKVSNVKIVDRASTPGVLIKPNKRLNLALGLILGLILGLGTAFVSEYFDTSIKTPKDIERYINLPLLGSIPILKTQSNTQDEVTKIISHLLTHHPTKSHISEAYRTLRTNLQFINPDNPIKTVLVTSAMPREGKSSASSNLAITMAQLGEKVLLVDTDLRKPILSKLFEIEKGNGITDVLIGKADIATTIISTKIDNLSLLPSGKIPPNPSELLGSQKMDSLIENLKRDFSFIIFDTPPAISVTDAAVLGSKVDGVLIIAQVGRTDRTALSHTKEIFERVRANILGIVLHMVPRTRGPYGYYYPYYHYYYYHYYSQEKEA
ncbi:polysaccharide biosynthesis tyrosine autokinase [candidate division WOR-3 bacterium]|nr:polysaccharide biosynthesis tyrosine autokinase [candidate division WOR-3 bacterium]